MIIPRDALAHLLHFLHESHAPLVVGEVIIGGLVPGELLGMVLLRHWLGLDNLLVRSGKVLDRLLRYDLSDRSLRFEQAVLRSIPTDRILSAPR